MKDEKEKVTLIAADVGKLELKPEAEKVKTVQTFCTVCNDTTLHIVTVDQNKETVLICKCGHPLKFPAGFDVSEGLKKHEAANGKRQA